MTEGASVRLRPYARPLGSGARNSRQRWATREGLLLEIEIPAPHGAFGRGEAAPLPGYSPEPLEAAGAALENLAVPSLALEDLFEIDDPARVPEEISERLERIPRDLPSARFALETALLDLLGRRLDLPLPALLVGDPEVRWTVPRVAPLVVDPAAPEDLPGAGSVKIKVGRPGAFEEELAALENLRRLRPDLEIRLDANGSWSADEALARLERLAPLGIRWIEEPAVLDDPERLRDLLARAAVPIALDESLARPVGRGISELNPAAVILKPQVLGGSLVCLRIAGGHRGPAVASHVFDGPVAYRATLALATALDRGFPTAHGLAVHDGLRAWPQELTGAPDPHAAGLGLPPGPLF